MKTYDIQLDRIKGMRQGNGSLYLQFNAQVSPKTPAPQDEPSSVLAMSEDQARVLMALIKTQLLELDKRKAKSRR